jgi:hypothetical protein
LAGRSGSGVLSSRSPIVLIVRPLAHLSQFLPNSMIGNFFAN